MLQSRVCMILLFVLTLMVQEWQHSFDTEIRRRLRGYSVSLVPRLQLDPSFSRLSKRPVSYNKGVSEFPLTFDATDDDQYLHSDRIQKLGEIQVEFWEVRIGDVDYNPTFGQVHDEKVHERSKKCMAHRVKYAVSSFHFTCMTSDLCI